LYPAPLSNPVDPSNLAPLIKRRITRLLPSRESIEKHRFLSLFGRWLLHPALWRLSRRSVAGGMAAGLLCGLIPGPFQMLGAGMLSVAMRWNAAVAMAVTIYTNPLTIIPIYMVAYRLGALFLRPGEPMDMTGITPPSFDFAHMGDSFAALWQWMLSLGWPLALGLVLLGLILAPIGYAVVWFGWTWWLVRARKRRRLRRESRLRSQSAAQSRS